MNSNITIGGIFNGLTALYVGYLWTLVGLGLLFFLWGMGMMILNSGDSEKLAEGKKFMVWSIVAIFLMVSVWGVIEVFQNTFSFDNNPPANRLDSLFPSSVAH